MMLNGKSLDEVAVVVPPPTVVVSTFRVMARM
jgi:hypothetical protein